MRIEQDQIKALVILSCLVGAFVLGLWLPHRLKNDRLRARINAAQAELGIVPVSPRELTDLAADVQRKREELGAATRYVPENTEIAELLRQLSSRLEQRQVVDQELLTEAIVRGSEFSVIPVSLKFRGTFPSVFQFIRDVESMRRQMQINLVELSRSPGKPHEPLDVKLELSTFAAQTGEATP